MKLVKAISLVLVGVVIYSNSIGNMGGLLAETLPSIIEGTTSESIVVTTPPSIVVNPVEKDIVTPELPILSVSIDYGSELLLDVFNIRGNGQVNTDEIIITNNSNVPISVSLKSLSIDNSEINLVDSISYDSKSKDLNLYLCDSNTGEVFENDFYIDANGSNTYIIKGEVNHSSPYWSEYDKFILNLSFKITPIIATMTNNHNE